MATSDSLVHSRSPTYSNCGKRVPHRPLRPRRSPNGKRPTSGTKVQRSRRRRTHRAHSRSAERSQRATKATRSKRSKTAKPPGSAPRPGPPSATGSAAPRRPPNHRRTALQKGVGGARGRRRGPPAKRPAAATEAPQAATQPEGAADAWPPRGRPRGVGVCPRAPAAAAMRAAHGRRSSRPPRRRCVCHCGALQRQPHDCGNGRLTRRGRDPRRRLSARARGHKKTSAPSLPRRRRGGAALFFGFCFFQSSWARGKAGGAAARVLWAVKSGRVGAGRD